ncbi:MAG: sigma 54-interacting transcriptional regulator [Thermodesulfobacteriota bacterium]|nr:sigma 54-interacting transcriptional regulator [Thermodesulfobacteriota bacterium]
MDDNKIDIPILMQNNERFQIFMEESIEPIWCFELDKPIPIDLPEDEQFDLIYSYAYLKENNKAYAQVVGYKRKEDLLGMRLSELMPPSIPENTVNVKQFIRSGYKLRDFVTVEFYKEKKFIILNNVKGIIKDGQLLRIWGTSRDITAQKAAEDQLRKTELRYRTVANFAYNWETWENPDGSYNYVSPSFERITGYPAQQLVNRPKLLNEIILPDDLTPYQEHSQAAHSLHETGEIQFRIRAKNGQTRWIEHICQSICGDQGEFLGVRASNRDITDKKQAEIEIRGAYEEIKQLKNQLEAESAYLQDEIKLQHNFEKFIGESEALKYVLHRVEQVASTDFPVLIMGETGTGKELVARALHKLSLHGKRALVKVNCAALPGELIESELFGREKGAFTGATTTQLGRFELAKGSTFFLDEIGELPLELQAKLLRVLESGEFERLGSSHTLHSDARIIAATNRVLEEEVRKGRFREDLWYRLKVFPITVPPLRERPEDIPLLVKWFVDQLKGKMGKHASKISKRTMQRLQSYPWPGNVRELKHAVEGALIIAQGKKLIFELPKISDTALSDFKSFEEMEHDYILRVLKAKNWKVGGENSAATALRMHVNTLRGRMKKLGIKRPNSP